jgi:hypothetical protein
MRRWKRIEEGNGFQVGDILILRRDDDTVAPEMMRIRDGYIGYSNTCFMVEIDENGNTIRTYSKYSTLNEGTLVGETMERLSSLEAASKQMEVQLRGLKAIIEKADKSQASQEFNDRKMYGARKGKDTYALVYCDKVYAFAQFRGVHSRWADCASGQEAIDSMIKAGGEVFEFTSKKSLLEFMLKGVI